MKTVESRIQRGTEAEGADNSKKKKDRNDLLTMVGISVKVLAMAPIHAGIYRDHGDVTILLTEDTLKALHLHCQLSRYKNMKSAPSGMLPTIISLNFMGITGTSLGTSH